jgi:DNA-binding response OmpR family regulator
VAVLDVNLGRETSFEIAHALRRRKIPFVFATGYDEDEVLPESLAGTPLVAKPYDVEGLSAALRVVLS